MSPASPNDQSLTVLLDDLRRAGIELHAEDGRLRFRAPRGALTPELRERLTVHRDEILERLQRKDRPLLKAHPEDAEAPFPLTDIQTSHLVGRGSAIDYGGLGCHGYTEIEFPDLDPVRLEDAWNRLVERHGMLRAGFDVAGWQQVPATRERVDIGVTDVRGQGIEAAQTVLDTTRERMAHQVYDIESWPLFELHVTRHDCGARLHFSIDLLIADARSITTLIDELVSLYLAPHEDLKPLDATFRDYVLALRAIQEPGHPWAERVAQDRDYSTAPEPTDFPPSRPASGRQPLEGAQDFRGLRWSITDRSPARRLRLHPGSLGSQTALHAQRHLARAASPAR